MITKTKKVGVNQFIFISLALIILQYLVLVVPIFYTTVYNPEVNKNEKEERYLDDKEYLAFYQSFYNIGNIGADIDKLAQSYNDSFTSAIAWCVLGFGLLIASAITAIIFIIIICITRKKQKLIGAFSRANSLLFLFSLLFEGFGAIAIRNVLSKDVEGSTFGMIFSNLRLVVPTPFYFVFLIIAGANAFVISSLLTNYVYRTEEYTPACGQDKYFPGNVTYGHLSEVNEFNRINQSIIGNYSFNDLISKKAGGQN